ncbi:hypothetical protein [Streptomyces sp. NPDC090093]|uniref:hypothetical protein n=1 Tax=Streptomyces sp. NPDC090093 TaxID=3365945 RepID=UPI00382BDA85
MATDTEIFAATIDISIDRFIDRIDAARDLIEIAAPAVAAKERHRVVFQQFLSELTYMNSEQIGRLLTLFAELNEKEEGETSWQVRLLNGVWEEFKGEPWAAKLATNLHTLLRRPSRVSFLLESTVISAVTSFEVLFSSLVSAYLKVSPQSLEALSREKDKEFSLRDLKGLSSIDEAVDLAISRRVDELMFGSMSEWRRFCIEKLNIKFDDLSSDWTAVKEIFQRRHVLVHAGGIASARYVNSIKTDDEKTAVTVGQRLQTNHEYVYEALDLILSFGILLASAIGIKFAPSHGKSILSNLHQLTYKRLLAKDDDFVMHLCSAGEKIAKEHSGKMLFMVNGWIALKRKNPRKARALVSEWDASALQDRYKLAKMCLLDESEAALDLMKKMYSSGDLSSEDVLEWPLFAEIRALPEYTEWSKGISLPFTSVSLFSAEYYVNEKTKVLHEKNCRVRGSSVKIESLADRELEGYRRCSICKPISK